MTVTPEAYNESVYDEDSLVVIFDGQGTHWPGMGRDVYEKYGAAREVYKIASEATGINMIEACFGSSTFLLKDTRVAQPAIATVGLAKYRAWQESNPDPEVVTGLSMGLYLAVGVSAIKSSLENWDTSEINYKTLKLVSDRAKIMYEFAEGKDGTMVPVIGPLRDDLERALKGTGATIGVYLDKTIHTLTGKEEAVENGKRTLIGLKARILDHLPIPLAAHHPLQEGTVEPLRVLLEKIGIDEPTIRIAANGAFYLEKPQQAIDHLLEQMTEPADWLAAEGMLVAQGIRNVMQLGADENRSLAKQMIKNHKSAGISSIVFPKAA